MNGMDGSHHGGENGGAPPPPGAPPPRGGAPRPPPNAVTRRRGQSPLRGIRSPTGYPRFRRFRQNPSIPFQDLPMRVLLLSSLLLTVTACTWVPIEPAGKATRVLPAGPVPAGCIAKGEVAVTVKSKVGFYNRNPLRVQEELETLARNEAPSAGANAVQAAAAPADGSQRFAAFQCPPR